AGINGRITGYEVGFQLGPRLNAAGRLENAEKALRLLLCKNKDEGCELARQLDEQNRQRQRIERAICDQARGRLDPGGTNAEDYVLVEGDASWHVGVVGIVAARMVQSFHRPTLVFGGDGENWRGSGRSIEGFDLAAALRECSDLLLTHGGHAMAAGLS